MSLARLKMKFELYLLSQSRLSKTINISTGRQNFYASHYCSCHLYNRVESTDSLRGRIRELESECKKLSMDMKLKEEQIRDLEGKCSVRTNDTFSTASH